jgi:hypothetical protein
VPRHRCILNDGLFSRFKINPLDKIRLAHVALQSGSIEIERV